MQLNKEKKIKNTIIIIYAIAAIALALFCVHKNNISKLYTYNTENIEIIDNGDGTKDYKYIETMLSVKDYYIDLAYVSNTDATIEIFIDNGNIQSDLLPATVETGAIKTIKIRPHIPTDRMKIKIHAQNDFQIIQTNLRCDTPLYSDYILYAIILLISIPLFLFIVVNFINSNDKKIKIILYLLYFCSTVFVLIRWNFIPFGADTRDHLQRIQGIMYGLIDNQQHVLIYPNMNNEYGQTAALYPSLFLYIPALFRYFNISLLASYNIMLIIVNIVSVFVMYHVSKLVFKNEKIAIAATIIHVFDASRMLCYMSGSMLATGLAMLFTPFIIYGIYSIIVDEEPKWQYLSLGFFGVVSSHVLQTVISIGVAVLIFLVCFKISANKKVIIALIKAATTFIIISLGTLIPFIKFYMMGFNQNKLVLDEFVQSQYDLEDFFIKQGHAFMAVMLVLIALGAVIYSRKIKKQEITKRDYYFRALFVVFLICMIMLSEIFPWLWLQRFGIIKTFTNMVQYPMRIFGSISVVTAFIFGYGLECIEKTLIPEGAEAISSINLTESDCKTEIINNRNSLESNILKSKNILNTLIIIMLLITIYSNRTGYTGYVEDTPVVFDKITGYFNSRNNEDYLPAGTKSEYYNSDSGKVSDEEKVKSVFYEKYLTHVNYSYETNSENEYAVFPLFYYDGYVASDENNEYYEVKKSDENKVMVMLKKTDVPKTVNLYYKVPLIYVIIDMVCAICLILLIYSILSKKRWFS